MSAIGWIVLGLLAGAIAKRLLPGRQPHGLVVTTLLGVVGALVGGAIARWLGLGNPIRHFFDASTWVAAIAGAVILLAIWGELTNRSRRGPVSI